MAAVTERLPTAGTTFSAGPFVLDQPAIDAYADVSRDGNPIHVDPAFAARTSFGGTIAHGMLTLALVADLLARELGEPWRRGGELDVAFVAPVRAGEAVEVTATVEGLHAGTLSLAVAARVGEKEVVVGTASAPASG